MHRVCQLYDILSLQSPDHLSFELMAVCAILPTRTSLLACSHLSCQGGDSTLLLPHPPSPLPVLPFRAQLFGWQDTYVFTKAMGEMLLGHGVAQLHRSAAQEGRQSRMRLAIVRPSIVESAMAEPFPGWMEGMR